MPSISDIDSCFIEEMLKDSLDQFHRRNNILLRNQLNEPCLNHHLANIISAYLIEHLDLDSTEIDIDCEYNKNLNEIDRLKTIFLTEDEARKYIRKYIDIADEAKKQKAQIRNIIPDIIVHKRNGENYIVIETKKRSSKETKKKEFDILKLKKYTSISNISIKYKYGIYIEIDDRLIVDNLHREHLCKIFKNGIQEKEIRLTTAST